MSQIKWSSEIEKDLFIVNQGLNEAGLSIQYVYNGKELEINIDEMDAAELLAKYGIVAAANRLGQVLIEDENEYMKWQEWHVFARANNLSEREAFHIAVGEEVSKSQKKIVGNIKAIPALVKSILTPTKPAM